DREPSTQLVRRRLGGVRAIARGARRAGARGREAREAGQTSPTAKACRPLRARANRGADRRARNRGRRPRAAPGRGLERRGDACGASPCTRRVAGIAATLGDRVRARADMMEPTPPPVGRWTGMGEALGRIALGTLGAAVAVGGLGAIVAAATGHSVSTGL